MVPIEMVDYRIATAITADVDTLEDIMTKDCNARVNWIHYNNVP